MKETEELRQLLLKAELEEHGLVPEVKAGKRLVVLVSSGVRGR